MNTNMPTKSCNVTWKSYHYYLATDLAQDDLPKKNHMNSEADVWIEKIVELSQKFLQNCPSLW